MDPTPLLTAMSSIAGRSDSSSIVVLGILALVVMVVYGPRARGK